MKRSARPTCRVARRDAPGLDSDQARLYELIWIRTIASQMESANWSAPPSISRRKRIADAGTARTGQVINSTFSGAVSGKAATTIATTRIVAASRHERRRGAETQGLAVTQHFTEPPRVFQKRRWSSDESSASAAVDLCFHPSGTERRGYVKLDKKRLHGEDKGRVVVAFLENFFARYVEYDFTANLEEQLDRISNNEISWQQVLRILDDFIGAVDEIKDLRVAQVLDALDDMLGHTSMRRAMMAAIQGNARAAAPASSI